MISVKNLKFTYLNSKKLSLKIDSLQVAKGGCLVLCGKSGSGKTTFARLLNGLAPEYYQGKLEGDIQVVGMQPGQNSVEEMSQKIASVFQNPATQFFHRKVEHELVFPCENQGIAQADIQSRLKQITELFNLEQLLNYDLLNASGGEQQRVAIATANMQNPQLVILDEPSANLDQTSVERLKSHLKVLKALGVTIVIAEHRLDFLKDLGDTYLYFENGEVTHAWSRKEWLALSEDNRHQLGLRSGENLSFASQTLPEVPAQNGLRVHELTLTAGKKSLGTISHLAFPAGKIIAILGQNGLGKSSFAKLLSGLNKSNGIISLAGRPLSEKERLKETAYVMQEISLQLFSDSVKKELLLGNQQKKNYQKIADNLGLQDLLQRHPLSLSGGEQQRVLIGNALLSDKKIFIFDEPTSGLDYEHMLAVGKLLQELKAAGKIVLVITHDKELVTTVCDYQLDFANYISNE